MAWSDTDIKASGCFCFQPWEGILTPRAIGIEALC